MSCHFGASLVAQLVKNLPAMQETLVRSQVGKIPWRRKLQPTPVIWPGKSHGQRSLVGYSPWGCKESNTTEQWTLSLSSCHFVNVGHRGLCELVSKSTQEVLNDEMWVLDIHQCIYASFNVSRSWIVDATWTNVFLNFACRHRPSGSPGNWETLWHPVFLTISSVVLNTGKNGERNKSKK